MIKTKLQILKIAQRSSAFWASGGPWTTDFSTSSHLGLFITPIRAIQVSAASAKCLISLCAIHIVRYVFFTAKAYIWGYENDVYNFRSRIFRMHLQIWIFYTFVMGLFSHWKYARIHQLQMSLLRTRLLKLLNYLRKPLMDTWLSSFSTAAIGRRLKIFEYVFKAPPTI